MPRAGPCFHAEVDRGVERLGLEAEGLKPRRQVDRNARILCDKTRQTRREPVRPERRQDCEVQRAHPRARHHLRRCAGNLVERAGNLGRIGPRRLGRAKPLAFAPEQADAQLPLQRLNETTHRALRQTELASRLCRAAGAAHGLEGREQAD